MSYKYVLTTLIRNPYIRQFDERVTSFYSNGEDETVTYLRLSVTRMTSNFLRY